MLQRVSCGNIVGIGPFLAGHLTSRVPGRPCSFDGGWGWKEISRYKKNLVVRRAAKLLSRLAIPDVEAVAMMELGVLLAIVELVGFLDVEAIGAIVELVGLLVVEAIVVVEVEAIVGLLVVEAIVVVEVEAIAGLLVVEAIVGFLDVEAIVEVEVEVVAIEGPGVVVATKENQILFRFLNLALYWLLPVGSVGPVELVDLANSDMALALLER